jgi:hypothetical protein
MSIPLRQLASTALASGDGVLRLLPVFVPRRFSLPGRRLKLHPDDYYALGTARGAIKERWLSSVIPAMNGPLAPSDEGMSYVWLQGDKPDRVLSLRDAIAEFADDLVGPAYRQRYGTFPIYSKFFDYQHPLFHHLHLDDASAAKVGRVGKPEAYYFPPQLNNHGGSMPVTYFGFSPEVTKGQVKDRLAQYKRGDNRITELSRAFRIELGTGWYTPPGVVHAPGSVLTYEPQWNSDVNSVYENVASGEVYSHDFLVENCPPDRAADLDYVIGLMDWEKNIDPDYRRHYFRPPIVDEATGAATVKWITYGNPYFSAKELTIAPGQSLTVREPMAFGAIVVQGYGKFGPHAAETPTLLRFGQPSCDEFFVGYKAATQGFEVVNRSQTEPMVILTHFGPDHPQAPRLGEG